MFRESKQKQLFVIVLIISLVVYSTVAYVSTNPIHGEHFFQLYILGETKMAEKYYPNDNPSISPNTALHWHLGVTNFMGTPRYVLVRAKLGNQTLQPPNETNTTPADLPVLVEFKRVLLDNETWEIPFTWKIVEARAVGSQVYLTLDMAGQKEVQVDGVGAKHGENFRMIIELWTLDEESGTFIFGWKTSNERRVAWLQIWFNATLPKQP